MKTFSAALVLLLLLLLTTTASAQNNSINVRFASTQYSGERASVAGESSVPFSQSSNGGYGIGYARQFTPRFSAAFDFMSIRANTRATIDAVRLDAGTMTVTPFTAIARVHAGRYAYAGAGIAYVTTSDLHSKAFDNAGIGTVSIASDTTYVLNAGVSIPATRNLHVDFDARYLPMNVRAGASSGKGTLKFNAMILGAGIGWRF
jgi:outer membrane protein W